MMVYIAEVQGDMWQGGIGETEYRFDHFPTLAEVSARAGDFEDVHGADSPHLRNPASIYAATRRRVRHGA